MTSKVFFRFKNAISQDQVLFDGSVIQIGDVKRLIAVKRGLGPEGAAELTLFDPNTNEEYNVDGKVIPRNSLVVVKRAPVTKFKPLQSASAAVPAQAPETETAPQDTKLEAASAAPDDFGGDYYSEQPQSAVVGEDEDKALQNLLQGTAATWQREVRQGSMRGRGRGRGGRGMPPLDYRCSRCDAVAQHWVQDCPTQGDPNFDRKRIRPPVGIPMTRLAKSEEGGLILPDGQTGTLVANEDAFAREILGLPTALAEPAAADAEVQPEQPATADAGTKLEGAKEGAVLLLDSKPHEVKQEPTVNSSDAVVHPSSSQPALPALAGEESLVAPVMPGAAFFNTFMQSVVMPRGPPEFVKKAFDREQPLSRSEFEELQAEFRSRHRPPLFPSRGGLHASHSPGRPASRLPRRSGSLSPEASRLKDLEQVRRFRDADARKSGEKPSGSRSRGHREELSRSRSRGRREKPSRSRSRERRSSREHSDRKEKSERRGEKGGAREGSHKHSHRSSSRHDEKSDAKREKDSRRERESSRRRDHEGDADRPRSHREDRRQSDHSNDRAHRRKQRDRKRDGTVNLEVERWHPHQEPTPEPEDTRNSGLPAHTLQSSREKGAAVERESVEQKPSNSPVAATVAEMEARLASPHNNTQHRSSSVGGAVVECESQQGNGIAEAAEMQGPRADEQSDLQHEEPQPDRHHKKHKKQKKEKKDKKEKKEKKHKEKRKHHSRSRERSASRSSQVDKEAQRLAAERVEQQKAEEERAKRETALRAEQVEAERRAQKQAEREKEKAAEQASARDKKLGPRLFDRAIVAAVRDKRPRHGNRAGGGDGESSQKRSKRSRR